MDQFGDHNDQVSMTIENKKMLLSFDSEVESPSPTLHNSFRSETNSKFNFINSTIRLSYDTQNFSNCSRINNCFDSIVLSGRSREMG